MGGKIVWSGKEHLFDEAEFSGSKSRIQVHSIDTGGGQPNKVGVELRHTSYMGFSVQPITLTVEQAKVVSEEINQAITNAHT